MLRAAFGLCAMPLLALVARAQQAPPDPASVMDAFEKQMAPLASAWLHRADQRTQAWGAYLVLRDGHTEAIPDLLALVSGFPVVEEPATQADMDQHDAMLGVLDALIQFGAQVPVGDAQRLYPEFPVQSLILLSRSQEDPSPALLAIFQSEHRRPAAWLAAGDLLVDRHADGFAAAIIEGMTVHAQVIVTQPGIGWGGGGSCFACGTAVAAKPKAGWPPLGTYTFAPCGSRTQAGATLLTGGADPVFYDRQVNASYVDGPSCGCNPDQDLVRQHYLTTMLSGDAEHPPVRAHVSHTILWQGVDAYRGDLAAFIGEQQHVFAELARRLGDLGLLSGDDAKAMRPKLEIRIWDQRTSPQPALPAVETLAENVTVEPF